MGFPPAFSTNPPHTPHLFSPPNPPRYIYFNAAMDYASGFDRTAMIGQNAKDHFPVHFQRYFEDDRAVRAYTRAPAFCAGQSCLAAWI